MNTSSYPLLFKHGIISNSDNDPGYVITFLMDRMAMADERADDREGQMWIRIQSNEQFWSSFSGINFVSEIITCIRDEKKKIVSGNPEKIKTIYDTWTFSRDMRSNNPNWLLINTLS